MSVERSGRGVLTTNADYTLYQQLPFDFTQSYEGSQFTIENNQIIKITIFRNPFTSDNRTYVRLENLTWTGANVNNDALEYGIIQRNYNGYTTYLETEFVDNGTPLNIYPEVQRPTDSEPHYSYDIYVRRKDGGILTPSDMEKSIVTLGGFIRYDTPVTTALPQDWLETTTQSIPSYTTQTTMLTTVDYESYLSTLTVPADVRPAIATLDQLINDLWSLHYIPFVVCFALIMGLAIWLLH